MTTAVVFDSAGTLLRVYRVAKDVRKGVILEHVASTNLVSLRPGCALVALKVDASDFPDGLDSGMTLSSYIDRAKVGMDVICRSSRCTTERIATATMGDTRATIGDMREAIAAVKLKCKDIYYVNMGFIVDVPRATIPYVLATGGRIFSGVRPMIRRLSKADVDVFIASGDNRRSLSALAAELGIPDSRVFDALSPAGKRDLVLSLKGRYDRVVMVGDGINDRLAIEAADTGILTVQQDDPRPQALYDSADAVITDIRDVEGIVKKSLHNIGRTNT